MAHSILGNGWEVNLLTVSGNKRLRKVSKTMKKSANNFNSAMKSKKTAPSLFALAVLLLMSVFLPIILTAGDLDQGLDLSSPEATVRSFTKAAAHNEAQAVQACFLPGGEDYEDIRKMMEASPGSPGYLMKGMLAALDTKATMPIIEKKETRSGTKVVWRVTFKREFNAGKGQTFKAGSTYDLDATLKKRGDRWLIDNL
jgi:hypothetical protein